jgi:uncharacterized protein (TIGR00266 family)
MNQQALAVAPQTSLASINHTIEHGPSFALLKVNLAPSQTLVAEAGSMVARDAHVNMDVKMNAGYNAGFFKKVKAFFIACLRKMAGGETFFVNHFSSGQGGQVWIAPATSGQIVHRKMNPGESLILSSGAYLASVGAIDVALKFGGLKSLMAKEGAFMLEVKGDGELFFTSYGGIRTVDVNGSFILDNGHLVGYEGNLKMNIKSAGGGLMGLVASGEGLVCEFVGQGRVYMQSRNLGSLVSWLAPHLR